MANYYEILGVSRGCTQDDIKRAFRAAAMKFHPDRGGNQEKFKEINAAHETLSDPARRAEYDRTINMSQVFENFGFDDFFININPFDPFTQRRVKRNKDLHINCQISLLDSLVGKQLEAKIPLPSGRTQTMMIDIPAGITNGTIIRYNNLGDDSIPDVPRGHLTVTVLVQQHPVFFREHDDLCTVLDINPIESIIGCDRRITSITGEEHSFHIKPGTADGQVYLIQEKGFKNLKTSKIGRFLARIAIKPLTIKNKAILSQLKTINAELTGSV